MGGLLPDNVARSAYHRWPSGKLNRRAAENEWLADMIEKIYAESPGKGYRRLNDEVYKAFDKAVKVTLRGRAPLFHSGRGFQYIQPRLPPQARAGRHDTDVAHCIDNGPTEGS